MSASLNAAARGLYSLGREDILPAPLGRSHQEFVKLVENRAVTVGPARGGVVLVDLSEELIEVAGKFVTYALYPESAYSIVVTRSKTKH